MKNIYKLLYLLYHLRSNKLCSNITCIKFLIIQ